MQFNTIEGWCCYIIETNEGPIYIGITNDLTKRFAQHNNGVGSKFVRRFNGIKRVLATFQCGSRVEAAGWEQRICKGFAGRWHGKMVYAYDHGHGSTLPQYREVRPCACNE